MICLIQVKQLVQDVYMFERLTDFDNADQQKKMFEQQLPVLFLQTLLYTFLVSVSPGKKTFCRKLF